MNKRFFISVLVTFVLLMICGFLAHGILLNPDYSALPNLYRTEAEHQAHFQFMLLAYLATAFAFVWIYRQGMENKPFLGQGLRFGLIAALLAILPKYLIFYAVQPMPGLMIAKQIVYDSISFGLAGIVVARLNR